ncbi:CobB/CobQ domain protein glutamine amidotransferase [Methanothermus fervidus DSM 2088]|uniref:Lipid II isoglutaminyl synthase (glutamine-hydrolyzing) subunit GatD n=1 Tax=Methanothermus fervidus (strain ATCC 43054 / DSM 2088 / JCM 10308 / V24 S) TaxID=523846 RepID=E3GWS7_METFV|nr:glutamine amidotransferase [Methanothermus fervidus]ADP77996.1 CobB/CobQ domain protein glutamine amidotransferase [Methanothermus fervidus DSM 2088]
MKLKLLHMYPDVLNLYRDRGNVITIKRRCEWRNIDIEIIPFTIHDKYDFDEIDIFFIGGGSDRGQRIVYKDFLNYRQEFKRVIKDDAVILAICGGYQLLGKKYIDSEGNELPGLGIFKYETISGKDRLIGNIIIENNLGLKPKTIVGFENHGGRTYSDYEPFGFVRVGYGNNGEDGKEGMVYRNCIGTYLHGPLLPKNPHLTDYLILKALERKYNISSLEELNDEIEYAAHKKVLKLYG